MLAAEDTDVYAGAAFACRFSPFALRALRHAPEARKRKE